MGKITIIRKVVQSYFYNDPQVISKDDEKLVFVDRKSGEKITLPNGDYQYLEGE